MADTATSQKPSASGLSVSVVTPEETVVETTADSLVLPLFDGEIGILRGHAPMIGRLGYGAMQIRTAGVTATYYVDGGFVQVADNVVSVLTNRAVAIDELDAEAAAVQLKEGLAKKAAGEDEIALRDKVVTQARAQLRLAGKP